MSLAVFETIGPLELLVVLGIVLVIFGPKRLPGLGRQLGSSMREFRDSIRGKADEDDHDDAPDSAARRPPRSADPRTRRPPGPCRTGSAPSSVRG